MTALQQRRKLSTWPISEAVMAHEPIRAGMKWARLDTVCRGLDHYDWSPPYAVAELDGMIGMDIVHPVTSMNRSFMIRNFQQDYHSLWSEKEVREGRSRARARTIRDFEVFARLYNSPHIQSSRDRAQAILEDARSLLEGETLFLLHGTNRLAEEKWRVRGSREHAFPAACLSDLPNWDEHQAHDMQSGEWIDADFSHFV
ncbi:hypothetical protein GOB87_02900 [Acetobacter estunensis]|uniref:Uncharacterized protein n=1 Tax=Acetobacter estunensis TaxID=104097 RepID=A0A967B380_9PROT|nr:hypothetical protein [Acetobacter estunensis]NHO52910.1 hypothetical protein [Acetobacter estunensis]